MNAPQKIELKTAGQSAMIHVVSAKMASVGKYPEVEFVGTDDSNKLVLIAVNKKSADRQLDRSNLTLESAVGKVLRFGRSANAQDATKPFWDIEVVGGNGNGSAPHHTSAEAEAAYHAGPRAPVRADLGPQSTAASVTPGIPDGGKPETPKDIYLSITRNTLKEVLPLYVEAKIPVSMEAVAAIVATRFIAATRNGH